MFHFLSPHFQYTLFSLKLGSYKTSSIIALYLVYNKLMTFSIKHLLDMKCSISLTWSKSLKTTYAPVEVHFIGLIPVSFLHTLKERFIRKNTLLSIGQRCVFPWSGVRESNPPPKLGKLLYYRCTNPANVLIISPEEQKGKQIWNMYRIYAELLCPIYEKLRKNFMRQGSLGPRDTKTGEMGCSRIASRHARCFAWSKLSNNWKNRGKPRFFIAINLYV